MVRKGPEHIKDWTLFRILQYLLEQSAEVAPDPKEGNRE